MTTFGQCCSEGGQLPKSHNNPYLGSLYKNWHLFKAGRVIPEDGASIKHTGSVGVHPLVPFSGQVDISPRLPFFCYWGHQDLQWKREKEKNNFADGVLAGSLQRKSEPLSNSCKWDCPCVQAAEATATVVKASTIAVRSDAMAFVGLSLESLSSLYFVRKITSGVHLMHVLQEKASRIHPAHIFKKTQTEKKNTTIRNRVFV